MQRSPAQSPPAAAERRRVQRVKLMEPLRGDVGVHRVFVVDASLRGLRLAHQEAIGAVGDILALHVDWQGRPIDLRCMIVRTIRVSGTLCHSGVLILHIHGLSAMALRELIETHVARAIDEQKSNARGIPAIAAQSFPTGRATHYARHELIGARWREIATTDPAQPANGFTVAADHSPAEVEMLRSAYEDAGDADSRELIRKLARLSISSDAVQARRYMP